jgi:hypothetical protein
VFYPRWPDTPIFKWGRPQKAWLHRIVTETQETFSTTILTSHDPRVIVQKNSFVDQFLGKNKFKKKKKKKKKSHLSNGQWKTLLPHPPPSWEHLWHTIEGKPPWNDSTCALWSIVTMRQVMIKTTQLRDPILFLLSEFPDQDTLAWPVRLCFMLPGFVLNLLFLLDVSRCYLW